MCSNSCTTVSSTNRSLYRWVTIKRRLNRRRVASASGYALQSAAARLAARSGSVQDTSTVQPASPRAGIQYARWARMRRFMCWAFMLVALIVVSVPVRSGLGLQRVEFLFVAADALPPFPLRGTRFVTAVFPNGDEMGDVVLERVVFGRVLRHLARPH